MDAATVTTGPPDDQVVGDLAFEVNLLEMPVPANPTPSGGSGHYWMIEGRFFHDNDEPIHVALAFFWDVWRREQARRLVEERGLPAELVPLVWARIPYESVPFREGWDEWRRRREATAIRKVR